MAETKPSCMRVECVQQLVTRGGSGISNFKFQISNFKSQKTTGLPIPSAASVRSLIGDRKCDRHRRAAAETGFHGDFAPMRLHDATDDGQAESSSLRPGRAQEGRECPPALLLGHADARVFHFD